MDWILRVSFGLLLLWFGLCEHGVTHGWAYGHLRVLNNSWAMQEWFTMCRWFEGMLAWLDWMEEVVRWVGVSYGFCWICFVCLSCPNGRWMIGVWTRIWSYWSRSSMQLTRRRRAIFSRVRMSSVTGISNVEGPVWHLLTADLLLCQNLVG